MAACTCARIGYALFLCQEHAPIPYTLTERAAREVRKLREWDVIEPALIAANKDRAAERRQALAAGRRIAARVKRERRTA